MTFKKDIPLLHDLVNGIIELVNAEVHSIYSFNRTKNERWLKIIESLRKTRGEWMEKVIRRDLENDLDETWCILKHLLIATKRFEEVGEKFLDSGDEENAKKAFETSLALNDTFWVINSPEFIKKKKEKS